MKTVYICEKCGKEFDCFEECMEHEYKYHQKPVWRMELEWYHAKQDIIDERLRRYPCGIVLEMEDGAMVAYRVDKIVALPKNKEKQDGVA